jgi:phosphotransferase system enzyme I (PtsI)
VTIRTLDLGADKADSTGVALSSEPESRARRARRAPVDAHPQLFATQLRAILRAASFGRVRILVPMVTTCEEVVATRAADQRLRAQVALERSRDHGPLSSSAR